MQLTESEIHTSIRMLLEFTELLCHMGAERVVVPG